MNNLKRIIGLIMAMVLCACNKETGEKQTDIERQTTGLQEVSELGSDISTEKYFPGVLKTAVKYVTIDVSVGK